MNKFIVYKVTFPNSKCYVGITSKSLEERKKQHYKFMEIRPFKFYNALKKYKGQEKWKIISTTNSWKILCKLERDFIKQYDSLNNGYNSTSGGDGNYKFSKDTLLKMSIWQKGKKLTKSHRQRLSEAKLGKKYGKRSSIYKTRKPFNLINKNTNEVIGTWTNVSECARYLGVHTACINRCLKYPNDFKSYKQYKLKYCQEVSHSQV